MILWVVLTVMIVLAAVGITIPMVRRYETGPARGSAIGVLRQQLVDLDRQVEGGMISRDEADALRVEIKRRILADGGKEDARLRPVSGRAALVVAISLAVVVAMASTGLYALLGHPQLQSRPTAASALDAGPAGPSAHPGGDVGAMIAQLETKLRQDPNDPEGWRMLGWSYLNTARYDDSASAYGRAAALDPANAEYRSAQGEALVRAANGQVTQPALSAFRQAIAADPGDPRARYFLAVYKDQQGDHHGAMADWIAMLRTAPPDAPWAQEVRTFVVNLARERGQDITGQLPPVSATAPPASAQPGPSQQQVEAADQMAAGDRETMIRGMVARLAGRLKSNPKDPDGWVQLMRARMVLGDSDGARTALTDGLTSLAGDRDQQDRLKQAARTLGVPGA